MHSPTLDHQDTRRHAPRLRLIMRDPKQTDASCDLLCQEQLDFVPGFLVQSGSGLVEKQYAGTHQESTNKGEALPLTRGQPTD
jgi:hypothetical protein